MLPFCDAVCSCHSSTSRYGKTSPWDEAEPVCVLVGFSREGGKRRGGNTRGMTCPIVAVWSRGGVWASPGVSLDVCLCNISIQIHILLGKEGEGEPTFSSTSKSSLTAKETKLYCHSPRLDISGGCGQDTKKVVEEAGREALLIPGDLSEESHCK